jgi:hypothetical protein
MPVAAVSNPLKNKRFVLNLKRLMTPFALVLLDRVLLQLLRAKICRLQISPH